MTDEEYEDLYREALHCLRESVVIGFPFSQPDGSRMCEVDGRLLGDDEVIERWWGRDIAYKIRAERGNRPPKFRSQSGSS